MKKFCVTYAIPPTYQEATVQAASKNEATKKILEVIPDAFDVRAWEVKERKDAKVRIA